MDCRVDIATRYRLDVLGFASQWGGEFLLSVIVEPGGGAHPFSYSVGITILTWGKVAGM